MSKIILVTGANKSIGFETARRLGALGHRVWLGSRDEGRGQTAARKLRDLGHDVRYVNLAVDDDASVRDAAAHVAREESRLDVLINNAGIPGNYAAPLDQGLQDVRQVYETNVFGPIRVTLAFVPLLQAAGKANVVNLSTGLASLGWLTDPHNDYYGVNLLGYNSSKTALNAITVSFAKALAPFGIRVNSADPGYVASDFTNHSGPTTIEQGAEIVVRLATGDDTGPTAGFFNIAGRLPW